MAQVGHRYSGGPPPSFSGGFNQGGGYSQRPQFNMRAPSMQPRMRIPQGVEDFGVAFDGKRMRKAVYRKTVDYNSSLVTYIEGRTWQRDHRDRRAVQPDILFTPNMVPPPELLDTPMNCVTSRFIRTSTNKIKCPIFCVLWTPEGRRLVTGASSGEFTLWNGLTFNFETILQAHDTSVRAMIWSHNDQWMLTADHTGFVKYWQSNMNNVKMYQAHKDPIRDLRCVGNPQPFCLALVDKCRVMYQIFDYLKLVFYLCSLIDMLTLYVLVQDVFTLTLFVLNLRKCVFAFHIFPRH